MMFMLFFLLSPPYFTNPLNPEQDLQELRVARREHHVDTEYWKQKLTLYLDLHALEKADHLIDELRDIEPNNPLFQDLKLMILSEKNELSEAMELGENLLKKFPAYIPATLNLSIVYFKAHKPILALNLLFSEHTKALRRGDWKRVMGFLNKAIPDPQEVLKMLDEKSRAFPENHRIDTLILAYLIREGAYDRAGNWISTHAFLTDDPDIKRFYEGMNCFEK